MMSIHRLVSGFLVALVALAGESGAQNPPDGSTDSISIAQFEDSIRHWNSVARRRFSYERYDQHQHREIAANLLLFQNADGGWPKNVDWLAKLDRATVFSLLSEFEKRSTFDNRSTYPQIEYLSKVFTATRDEKYRAAAERGLNFILTSQHTSGGWHGSDVDAITFNDDVMTGVMHLLLDIVEGEVARERRMGYAWYGYWPEKILREDYPRWLESLKPKLQD